MDIKALRQIGETTINTESHAVESLPMQRWTDFPLHFSVEYKVKDYAAEIGFWVQTFGVTLLSIDDEYALLTDADRTFTISIKADYVAHDVSGFSLQWFTDNLGDTTDALDARGIAYETYYQSSNQRFVRLQTPAGVNVEIWSGHESHCPC